MPAYRYFVDAKLEVNEEVTITDQEYKHLKSVMRLQVGDTLEITNGKGAYVNAKIQSLKKRDGTCLIEKVKQFKLSHQMRLKQAYCKLNSLDWLIEKATELGVTHIDLYPANRSQLEIRENKMDRLLLKAISALKQSGRLFLPQINLIGPIKCWEKATENSFYGDLSANAKPLISICEKDIHSYTFCNGPESGFDEAETSKLKQLGYIGASLHPNILRTETAPLSFLSIVYQKLLDGSHFPLIN